MKIKTLLLVIGLCTPFFSQAHTAIMECFDEGDGYITCSGGFSNGASAEGVEFRIEQNGVVVMQTKMDEEGEISFEKPVSDFIMILDGGEGHVVDIDGRDVAE